MKVLWITNLLFPEASALLSGNKELKNSGGWMLGAAKALVESYEIDLVVATVSGLVQELTVLEGENMKYFVLPLGRGNLKYNQDYELYWRRIKEIYNPDIINIYGSEFSHGLAWVKANGSNHVVLTIQGLTSVIKDYYYTGLSFKQVAQMCMFGILPLLRKTGLDKYNFQSKNEIALIDSIHNVIGRTSWDRAHIWAINPKVKYYFCNETLRAEFYSGKWEYDQCKKHTIFVSQIGKSIKGFHQLIKALPLVLKEYPDTKVVVAGNSIYYNGSYFLSLKNRYNCVARKMIKKGGLDQVFDFVGPQDEKGMKKYLLSSNVFVLSSSIENSPNSLGEAQLLGVPCISSYVGGVSDMIPNSSCGMIYRFSDYQMLAYQICTLFETSVEFDNSKMRENARIRHDAAVNARQTLNIYREILNR